MAGEGNILITDESALHALLHADWANTIESSMAKINPLAACASTLEGLRAFNVHHPLYGPPPIVLLVARESDKRFARDVTSRYTQAELPPNSFFELRQGLFMATPELVFVRMASQLTEVQLAEVGMNLCGRYCIDEATKQVLDRSQFITTPDKLRAYAASASHMRGSSKARTALKLVLPNSGSPYETKLKLLFCHPVGRGGFGLPFTAMNYDVSAGRLERIMAQSFYSIDLVNELMQFGVEYDGGDAHPDASEDKRRRNELATLGWRVFPIDKEILHDPEATIRAAEQIAKQMHVRLRRSVNWEKKYLRLRAELNLPI